jgi:hypothetical protein
MNGRQLEAVREVALESARENVGLNLICMEGLSTNALKIAQWKRDKCILLAQQVNLELVGLRVADEQMQKRSAGKEANSGGYFGLGTDQDLGLSESRLQDSDFYTGGSSLTGSHSRQNGSQVGGAPTWNPFQDRNAKPAPRSNIRRINFQ